MRGQGTRKQRETFGTWCRHMPSSLLPLHHTLPCCWDGRGLRTRLVFFTQACPAQPWSSPTINSSWPSTKGRHGASSFTNSHREEWVSAPSGPVNWESKAFRLLIKAKTPHATWAAGHGLVPAAKGSRAGLNHDSAAPQLTEQSWMGYFKQQQCPLCASVFQSGKWVMVCLQSSNSLFQCEGL